MKWTLFCILQSQDSSERHFISKFDNKVDLQTKSGANSINWKGEFLERNLNSYSFALNWKNTIEEIRYFEYKVWPAIVKNVENSKADTLFWEGVLRPNWFLDMNKTVLMSKNQFGFWIFDLLDFYHCFLTLKISKINQSYFLDFYSRKKLQNFSKFSTTFSISYDVLWKLMVFWNDTK